MADFTNRAEMKNAANRWQTALDVASDAIFFLEPQTYRVTELNQAACRLLGCRPEDVIGQPFQSLSLVAAEVTFVRPRRAGDSVIAVVRRASDAGDSVALGANSQDELTGLPSRRRLIAAVSAALSRWKEHREPFAVFFLDLDRFKEVNDSHGHLMGDRVLQAVAHRLQSCVRDRDLLARYGGDEFVLLVHGIDGQAEVSAVSARIRERLHRPLRCTHLCLEVSATIGSTLPQAGDSSPESIIDRADRSMYDARRAARDEAQIG